MRVIRNTLGGAVMGAASALLFGAWGVAVVWVMAVMALVAAGIVLWATR